MSTTSSVGRLDAATVRRLQAAPLTYPEVGRVLTDPPPDYRFFRHSRRIRSAADFDALADAVLTWQVQAGSGLRVASSSERVQLGTVAVLRLGPLHIPCRVVTVVDEPHRRGFAYGTLPGHPERGEEAFVVERHDGETHLSITAFSQPASRLARLGGPATLAVQDLMTRRYLHSLDR